MKNWLKVVIIIVILIGALLVYSRYAGTKGLFVKEYKIASNTLPETFHGLKIVHFSDLHYKRIKKEKDLEQVINNINELNPDIVIFTGDLFDTDVKITEEDISFMESSLKKIKARLSKYAIYGNHDYKYDINRLKVIYNNSGFIILKNSYDIVYKGQDKIFIGGVDDTLFSKPDIKETMNYFNNEENNISYKIVLVHEPDYTKEIVNNYPDINLILSGHSHNGQIVIPLIGAVYTPKGSKKYYGNHYLINNTDLYISSGIGVSKVNLRLFNRPSINFYRMVRK